MALMLSLSLAACGGNTPLLVKPSAGTVNGYTIDVTQKDTVKFNVSALDGTGKVILDGNINSFSVQVQEIKNNPADTTLNDVTVATNICGQYTSTGGPITCTLVLDASGSMKDTDPNKKRAEAAKTFVSRIASTDQTAIANFGAGGKAPYTELNVHQAFTTDKTLLNTAIDKATLASGDTPLWKSTTEAVDLLSKTSGQNKIALVLTDGKANTSDKDLLNGAIAAAQKANVKLFMVGLAANSIDEADMQKAAQMTSGLYSKVSDAASLNDLFNKAFNQSQAFGCLQVVFKLKGAVPPTGTEIKGTLTINMNGGQFVAPFAVTFL